MSMFSIAPINFVGKILIVISLILIIIEIMKAFKKRREQRGDILGKWDKYYDSADMLIGKVAALKNIKEKLQLKYGVLSSSTERKNRKSAIKTIIIITITTLILGIFIFKIIKIWYMSLLIMIGFIFFSYIILFTILNFKLLKLKRQFPEAINIFITKYTSDKNKDIALRRTYGELDNPIRYEFRRLSTMSANKSIERIQEAIKSFYKRVDYIWAEVFGELLLLNHTTVKDIGDELHELSILMAEDQAIEVHKRSEIGMTKAVNYLVALCVFLAIFFNVVFLKNQAIHIYFESYLGIMSIGIAVVVTIVCLSLTYYFEKS